MLFWWWVFIGCSGWRHPKDFCLPAPAAKTQMAGLMAEWSSLMPSGSRSDLCWSPVWALGCPVVAAARTPSPPPAHLPRHKRGFRTPRRHKGSSCGFLLASVWEFSKPDAPFIHRGTSTRAGTPPSSLCENPSKQEAVNPLPRSHGSRNGTMPWALSLSIAERTPDGPLIMSCSANWGVGERRRTFNFGCLVCPPAG